MPTKDYSTRLIDMSLGEALELTKPLLADMLKKIVSEVLSGQVQDEWDNGLKAIRDVFDCSSTMAVQLHHDPRYFGKAIFDEGRKIMVNKTKLRKLKEQENSKRQNRK